MADPTQAEATPDAPAPAVTRPDLAALAAHYQQQLRLLDWRIDISYAPDLTDASGNEVWGLCYPLADAKVAKIAIRDPQTPPRGASAEEAVRQVTDTVIHELVHLHFSAFDNRSPAEIVAEEQAVWALTEALVTARNTPAERVISRAMVANITRRHGTVRAATAGVGMDPELVAEALDALTAGDTEKCAELLKGLVVNAASGGAPPPAPEEPAPEMGAEAATPAPEDDEEKKPEMMAAARLVLSLTGKSNAGEAMAEMARRSALAVDLEAREAKLAKDRATIEANERRELVGKLVKCGAETPAFAWASDAKGLPDGKTPADEYAAMPLERLRAKVLARSAAPKPSAPKPPAGTSAVTGLSDREVAMCKTKKIDPAKYAEQKAAIAARSGRAPVES